MSNILNRVESALADFRPSNQREFVALHLAQRFNDSANLAKYLLLARSHSKRSMLDAARAACQEGPPRLSARFFELLEARKEAA